MSPKIICSEILKLRRHVSAKMNSICDELRLRGLGLGTTLLEDLGSVSSTHAIQFTTAGNYGPKGV